MRPHPTGRPFITIRQCPQQRSGLLVQACGSNGTNPSHRTHRLARLPLEVSPKRWPRPMTVLAGDHTLSVGEPQLVG
jgi:hypothetical protein